MLLPAHHVPLNLPFWPPLAPSRTPLLAGVATDPPTKLYMGKDKYENEVLLKYGDELDVWFHVDKLSSAHVYLRLHEGAEWQDIPKALLEDIGQLTKANSIEGALLRSARRTGYMRPEEGSLTGARANTQSGNKKQTVTIIYTPWSNIKVRL